MKRNISKITTIFLLLIVFLITGLTLVKANSGPPTNVQIEVVNHENEFEFDLLININTDLNQSMIDEVLIEIADGDFEYITRDTEFLIFLSTYQDSEGFVSNLLYGDPDYYYTNNHNDSFFATMYLNVPLEFKILLYTNTEAIITSELITMSQYDYRLTYDLTGVDMDVTQDSVGVITGYNGNPWLNFTTWFNFLLRLITTLTIEIGVLYLFGFRKKSTYIRVGILNVISQILLNIALISAFYNNPSGNGYNYLFNLIIGEFFVFTLEAIIVSIVVKEHKIFRRIGYSFIANAASLFIGLMLASVLSFVI